MKKLFALILSATAITAHAEFWSGNDLLAKLQSSPGMNTAQGLGYIMGVFDSSRGIAHCPPEDITAGQVRDMVRNHLEATPSTRHIVADVQVRYVLNKAWPCTKNNGV